MISKNHCSASFGVQLFAHHALPIFLLDFAIDESKYAVLHIKRMFSFYAQLATLHPKVLLHRCFLCKIKVELFQSEFRQDFS